MKFCDSHTDFLTKIESQEERERYIRQMNVLGGEEISCAVFTTTKGLGMQEVEAFAREVQHYNKKYGLKLMLSIEDLGFAKDLQMVERLCRLKPFSTTLTWNKQNQFCGGAHSMSGLTPLGMEAISVLENNGVLVDTAHLSRKGFYEVAKITKCPLYNSHSNIFSLKKHCRNLKDDQIEKIVKREGFLGLTFYDKFISDKKLSCEVLARQFDYVVKKFGCDHFGIGSDLYGIAPQHLPVDLKGYWQLDNLAAALRKLGYSEGTIEKLFYKNFQDFLKRVGKY
ncbi:MAG: membrane dipeptidase [Clostridia bacterium]|nr:membrane dipeptidase [Clostridia bacterium]